MTPQERKREYNREYYARKREEIRAQQKNYYAKVGTELCKKRRPYLKEWYAANKPKVLAQQKEYKAANAEKVTATIARWKKEHPEKMLAYGAAWSKRNPHMVKAKQIRRKLCLTPPAWADHDQIRMWYEVAAVLSKTGVPFDVDHVVPLKSPFVCGLHTHDNLQVLPRWENRSKGNRVWPDMPKEF